MRLKLLIASYIGNDCQQKIRSNTCFYFEGITEAGPQ